MFAYLIRQSLTHRIFVSFGAVALIVIGSIQLWHTPVDALPEIDRSVVWIITESTGLSPEEVERRISFPLETAMMGVRGVEKVRSKSGTSLSIVSVAFAMNTDIFRARQMVVERLAQVRHQLPANVRPELGPLASVVGEILRIGLTIDDGDMMALRDATDWLIRPRLLAIPGVSQVIVYGGEVRQLRVTPDPRRLDFYGIGVDQIERALAAYNSNTGGGSVDQYGRRFQIVNLGRAQNSEALLEGARDVVVGNAHGRPISLREVATVSFAPRVKQGDGGFMGQLAVGMNVLRQPGVNTLELTRHVKKALLDLRPFLPPGVHVDNIFFEQAEYIEESIANLTEVIIAAAVIVIVVLSAFLLNSRTTIISLTAIPISLLITVLVFRLLHQTINTMTLGGLAIAIGELVDDAVVGVENIFRRLRLNRQHGDPLAALQVISDATVEVRSAIFYATVIVLLVLFPLFALPGLEGLMFKPMAIAYIVSIVASLFTSITLTPVLAYYLLPRMKRMAHRDAGLVRLLKRQNTRLLAWGFDHWKTVAGVAVAAVSVASVDLTYLPRAALPPLNEGTHLVQFTFLPGMSLAQSNELAMTAEKLILEVPEVKVVGHRTGRAEHDLDADPVYHFEIVVRVGTSQRPRSEIVEDIRKRVRVVPAVVNVTAPITDRIESIMGGFPAQLAVKLFGPDLDNLVKLADQLRGRLTKVGGLTDLRLETQARIPQLRIRINPDAARLYGITPAALTRTLETLSAGRVVSEVVEASRRYDVVIRLNDVDRTTAGLRSLLIDTPAGRIPLHQLAELTDTDGPNEIVRDNGQRRIAILANTDGSDMAAITAGIKREIVRLNLPPGYFFSIEGDYKEQKAAMMQIGVLSLGSLILIFAILYSRYNSTVLTLIIMANVPLALVGSVVALRLTGGTLSLASAIGFITLAGISTRNGILKISHYINLVLHEGETFGRAMIVRGSLERMTPVLMTALCAGLALIPIMVGSAGAGKEILSPVAVVIFGGLISATLLDAVLTPVLFLKLGAKPLARLQAHWIGRSSEAY